MSRNNRRVTIVINPLDIVKTVEYDDERRKLVEGLDYALGARRLAYDDEFYQVMYDRVNSIFYEPFFSNVIKGGERVHKYLQEYMNGMYGFEPEIPIRFSIGEKAAIVGWADLVDYEGKRIIEIKTVSKDKIPKLKVKLAVRQVVIYAAILGFKNAEVWFADRRSNKIKKRFHVRVKDSAIGEILIYSLRVLNLIKHYEQLKPLEIIQRVYSGDLGVTQLSIRDPILGRYLKIFGINRSNYCNSLVFPDNIYEVVEWR